MLLAIDMGNTQTSLGLFAEDDLVRSWCMPTDRCFTSDEIHMRLHGYFHMCGMELSCVDAIAFAGVVPELTREWRAVAERLRASVVMIGADTAAVTRVRARNPREIGADRISNAVAAEMLYGGPSIVVDFGTATNIDVIDAEGYYIGGAIAPGIRISADALSACAARLASISLEAPPNAIGRNTIEAMQSGIVMGAAAMAEGMIARIQGELDAPDARVIATGGLAGVIAGSTDVFDVVDPQLTLKGVHEIYRRMQARGTDHR